MARSESNSHPTRQVASVRRRWLLWPPIVFLLAVGAVMFPLVLATTVIPPADPQQPVTAFLLDYGHTSGLVLPTADGMAEYVYGDCDYYARGNRGLGNAAAALCWPTSACMGRGTFDGPATQENLLRRIHVNFEHAYPIRIDREAAERLEARLHDLYLHGHERAIEHPGFRLTFVPHPRAYHYFHNSNHVTAAWLVELGCQVQGPAFSSRWRVVQQP